jgi:amidase
MSAWFSASYMARRGIAAGRVGKTHHLTEAKQGSYQYVYGPYATPVLTIAPGDVVVAETLDAFGGAIKSVDDRPSEKLKFPFVNPQNGPIAVEGAEKGDVLCVRIETIAPRGPQPVGTSALIPEFGGLVGTPARRCSTRPCPNG